jgi:hypothetical protein
MNSFWDKERKKCPHCQYGKITKPVWVNCGCGGKSGCFRCGGAGGWREIQPVDCPYCFGSGYRD